MDIRDLTTDDHEAIRQVAELLVEGFTLHWPDAFPAGDLGLRRAMGGLTEGKLRKLSEPWRPWRSYAAMHLWMKAAQPNGSEARRIPPATVR